MIFKIKKLVYLYNINFFNNELNEKNFQHVIFREVYFLKY